MYIVFCLGINTGVDGPLSDVISYLKQQLEGTQKSVKIIERKFALAYKL